MPVSASLHHDVENFVDHLRVQRGGGLVKEHDFRFHAERSGNGDALLLSSRELCRVLVRLFGNVDPLEIFPGPCLGIGTRYLSHTDGSDREVLENGQMGKQVELLEHHADFHPDGADVRGLVRQLAPVDEQPSGPRMLLQAVDAPYERGLAGAGGTADDDPFTRVHGQGHVGERLKSSKELVHASEFDNGCAVAFHRPGSGFVRADAQAALEHPRIPEVNWCGTWAARAA